MRFPVVEIWKNIFEENREVEDISNAEIRPFVILA